MSEKKRVNRTANDVATISGNVFNHNTRVVAIAVNYNAQILKDALNRIAELEKAIKLRAESEADLDEVDKQEIAKSVLLLDIFTKTYCRYRNDYERFDDLKFRCDECPFSKPNGDCICKEFKNKYAPDYKDFGSMGDL